MAKRKNPGPRQDRRVPEFDPRAFEGRVFTASILKKYIEIMNDRPRAVQMSIKPVGIPPTLPRGQILKWARAAQTGKSVAVEIDFFDGEPPLETDLPIPPRLTLSRPRRPGAPRKLTSAQYADSIRRYPNLSERQRAKMLNVSRTAVRTARDTFDHRRKSSGPK